ncbi:MAG: DHH family phosphoesterase [Chitinivibrionales bacterium]|nr:DHH family phosphoesterase [Chitinivibrionales bacterium]
MQPKALISQKIEDFKNHILPASYVLIVTHDYPDPDCLATAFAVQHLLTQVWHVKTAEITFGGFVGRAENRAMIRYLNIRTVPIMLIEFSDFERIILVDSFPGDGNVSLPSQKYPVHAVLDHHPHKDLDSVPFFNDIRDNLGSTSTIITQYLRHLEVPIPTEVATALFYGIKTDTNHLSRHITAQDLDCYKFLFDFVDHHALSQIILPDRDAEYFRVLHRAVESLTVFESTFAMTHLGAVTTPDYIPEIADLFRSLENLEWMVCSGIFKNQIFFSIRSRTMENAGRVAEKVATSLEGHGGGHATMAAGRIPLNGENMVERFHQLLRDTLLILNIEGKKIL